MSGARSAPDTPIDPDLALILDYWATLPEQVRQAVLASVRSASENAQDEGKRP